MEQTNLGQIEIGTKESEKSKLEPAKLKIVKHEIENIEKANAKKVVFEVKHPDREETIKISAVSYLDGKQVVTTGTWFNLDEDEKIVKNSSLANFLSFIDAKNLDDTKDKEVDSELDDKGYLAFKAY